MKRVQIAIATIENEYMLPANGESRWRYACERCREHRVFCGSDRELTQKELTAFPFETWNSASTKQVWHLALVCACVCVQFVLDSFVWPLSHIQCVILLAHVVLCSIVFYIAQCTLSAQRSSTTNAIKNVTQCTQHAAMCVRFLVYLLSASETEIIAMDYFGGILSLRTHIFI